MFMTRYYSGSAAEQEESLRGKSAASCLLYFYARSAAAACLRTCEWMSEWVSRRRRFFTTRDKRREKKSRKKVGIISIHTHIRISVYLCTHRCNIHHDHLNRRGWKKISVNFNFRQLKSRCEWCWTCCRCRSQWRPFSLTLTSEKESLNGIPALIKACVQTFIPAHSSSTLSQKLNWFIHSIRPVFLLVVVVAAFELRSGQVNLKRAKAKRSSPDLTTAASPNLISWLCLKPDICRRRRRSWLSVKCRRLSCFSLELAASIA